MALKYEFRILDNSEPLQLWDEAIKEIPAATFFHTHEWLRFVEKQFRLELKRILIYSNNKITGIFPLFEKKYGFMKIAGSPLIAENNPYMGFALRNNKEIDSIMPALNKFLKDQHIDFFRASFDNIWFKDSFELHGYTVKEKKSFRLDLSVEEESLWKGIGQKGRNLVRKAEKSNLVLTESTNSSFIDSYFEMSKEVYARQGLPPLLQKSYYSELFLTLVNTDSIKVFMLSTQEGAPVAGAIILIYSGNAYYLDGVSFREYSNLGINNSLQWSIIKYLKATGVVTYDMLGGDIPGIANFKQSFGTTNCPTIYVEKPITLLSKAARNIYSKKKYITKMFQYYMNMIRR